MSNLVTITANEAFKLLNDDARSVVIDVRTRAEWENIGVPFLPDRQIKFITSHLLPKMNLNPEFSQLLRFAVVDQNTNLLFICRSNGRSRVAAELANQLGYVNCYVIIDGFEGTSEGVGWAASCLPSSKRMI